jgi:hypothetical protein
MDDVTARFREVNAHFAVQFPISALRARAPRAAGAAVGRSGANSPQARQPSVDAWAGHRRVRSRPPAALSARAPTPDFPCPLSAERAECETARSHPRPEQGRDSPTLSRPLAEIGTAPEFKLGLSRAGQFERNHDDRSRRVNALSPGTSIARSRPSATATLPTALRPRVPRVAATYRAPGTSPGAALTIFCSMHVGPADDVRCRRSPGWPSPGQSPQSRQRHTRPTPLRMLSRSSCGPGGKSPRLFPTPVSAAIRHGGARDSAVHRVPVVL